MTSANKDAEYLDRLRDYYADNRRIPSFQRIAELMGFSSRTASDRLLERLESAGYMERAPDDGAWIPAGRFFERSLVNASVRAGTPDAIDGTGAEPFLVDNYLVRHPSSTVMVPVKGDSMIDAGIHEGDIIAVERNKAAKPGDFVVAIVDNEFTLKELGVERGRFILKPHNPSYAVIRPKGELEVFGVMVGLVRRYAS
ncbi:MAG: LexA family transcriptional regulator [Rugosibacter sp.]|nr:LexA family transcriptional regulator [Rugosibacter sp.]